MSHIEGTWMDVQPNRVPGGQQERETRVMSQESIEELLRPLAEATVNGCTGKHPLGLVYSPCLDHDVLDERFEALRLRTPQRWAKGFFPWVGGVDASLGAIRRAMVACGWNMLLLTTYGEKVFAEVLHSQQSKAAGVGQGANDAEAAARALVAAWRDEKLHAATGAMQG